MSGSFHYADARESDRRSREVRLLVNVVEPDPAYQPTFVSDDATFFDVSGHDEALLEERLRSYFRGMLPAPLTLPIWQFVDRVKERCPGWPEVWPPHELA